MTNKTNTPADNATIEAMKIMIEHAPANGAPGPGDLLGWTNGSVSICNHCAGRIAARGCKFGDHCKTPVYTDSGAGLSCDLCGADTPADDASGTPADSVATPADTLGDNPADQLSCLLVAIAQIEGRFPHVSELSEDMQAVFAVAESLGLAQVNPALSLTEAGKNIIAAAVKADSEADNVFEWSATYCVEDNKLRLYFEGFGRFTDDDKNAIKSAGYRWASKQECYVCPRWTITAEDMALTMAGCVSPEEYGPEERAADRAERFAGYREKRAAEASGYADTFEAGPAVHGYQNQNKADRAAKRHNRQRVNAVSQWNKAEYWQQRTSSVINHAERKSMDSGLRRRRILKIEKEQRKHLKTMDGAESRFALWQAVLVADGIDSVIPIDSDGRAVVDQLTTGQLLALQAANNGRGGWGKIELPGHANFFGSASDALTRGSFRQCADDGGYMVGADFRFYDPENERADGLGHNYRFTPREVAEKMIGGRAVCFPETSGYKRWANHYANRLAFENSMLEAEGGKASEVDIVVGGWVLVGSINNRRYGVHNVDGWAQVLKVNKSPATKRVTSVEVAGWSWDHNNNDNTSKIDRPQKLNVESSGAGVYRAPTSEELEAFKAKTKAAKAKAKKNAPKKPKLLNLDAESAQRLQDLWNARASASVDAYNAKDSTGSAKKTFEPSEIREMTQAQYSANSKGSYANFETGEVMAHGSRYARRDTCPDVAFKVRWASGKGFGFSASRVIVITDKPRKPAPLDWSTIEGKSVLEATEALKPAPTPAATATPGLLFSK